jgi:hypothetical protein
MALIAPFARVTRSTNRSTPDHGDHRMPATERHRRPFLDRELMLVYADLKVGEVSRSEHGRVARSYPLRE